MRLKPQSLGFIEGWASTIINTVLFFFKYWVGSRFNSIAMKADAWHTLSDSLTSIVVLLGFWISAQKADKDHPFGHGRAEVIAAIIIGTLLAVVGVIFMLDSVTRFMNYQAARFGLASIIVFSISVIIKEALAEFSMWAGKKINASSLIADGWHHRSDAIASGLIVVGALFGRYYWWLDSFLGIMVSLLILYASYDILKSSISPLLGENPRNELTGRIKDLIRESVPMKCHFHHLHVHRYGDHTELTFHIKLPPAMSLKQGHTIVNTLEEKIRKRLKMESTIHVEPFD